jgi:hypothetical protein
MQPLSERTRLSPPRYRIEERTAEQDTSRQYQTLLARRAAQPTRAGVQAELVVIDQDSEVIVARRDVWLTPKF